MQANGALCSATDVLKVSDVHSMRNINYGNRFKILLDRRVHTSSDNPIKFIEFHKKLQTHIEFKGTTGVVGDVSKNNFFLIAVSD